MNLLKYLPGIAMLLPRANDNDALIPEIWSREALATLMSQTIMAQLVHRDFSPLVAQHGDVVNTSRPADFTGKRKIDSEDVTDQDAVSANIRVPLDQHFHVSFVIKDGELSKALPDLLERYMEPAARELAEKVDQVLVGQVARLLGNQVGEPTAVTSLNVDDYVLDADEKLNANRAPKFNRYFVCSSKFNRAALGAEIVTSTEKRGDEGTALREANVGRIYGLDTFMNQNVNSVNPALAFVATGVTDGVEAAGATVIETTVPFASVAAGQYVHIAGSQYLHRIASAADATSAADITLTEGITHALGAGVAVTVYRGAVVDGAELAGYATEIDLNGYTATLAPQVGQIVTFGTGVNSHSYTIVTVTTVTSTSCKVLLDRPLDAGIDNDALAFLAPGGSRNIAFTREAIALVTRPLASVANQAGARSGVANFDGLSMRVTMQYDSKAQGTRVTFDLLCGVAVLDQRLAVVVHG